MLCDRLCGSAELSPWGIRWRSRRHRIPGPLADVEFLEAEHAALEPLGAVVALFPSTGRITITVAFPFTCTATITVAITSTITVTSTSLDS
jgi:hypothetical protein